MISQTGEPRQLRRDQRKRDVCGANYAACSNAQPVCEMDAERSATAELPGSAALPVAADSG